MGSRKFRWLPILLVAGPLLGLALTLVFWPRQPTAQQWQEETAGRYEAFWQGLEKDAENTARQIAPLLRDETAAPKLFAALLDAARQSAHPDFSPRPSFLLLNPDGDAVAWAGKGLQHEPAPHFTGDGRFFKRGVTAATLWVQRTLPAAKRRWHLIVGVSFPDTRLIFSPYPLSPAVRWSVTESAAPGGGAIEVAGKSPGPILRIEDLRFENPRWLVRLPYLLLLGLLLVPRWLFQRGARLPRLFPDFFGPAIFLALAFLAFWAQKKAWSRSSTSCPGGASPPAPFFPTRRSCSPGSISRLASRRLGSP